MNFKSFLSKILSESGKATEKWSTSRATKSDIETALKLVSNAIDINLSTLKNQLLGSTELTLLGYKDDSGDVDIALELKSPEYMDEIHSKMMNSFNNEGILQKGIKVGSYAIPVSNKKKIQVDLMFVPDVKWAKFNFFSGEGKSSKYKGAVRNELLMAALRYSLKPNEDLIVLDDSGNVIARASRAWIPSQGIKRVFKIAPINKKGTARLKGMVDISPEELKKELIKIDPKYKDIKFNDTVDLISDPDKAVEHIFGKGVTEKDVVSAEDIIKLIKKTFSKSDQEKIFKDVSAVFKGTKVKLPPEITI
ncbi:MAG: hypothetical protein QXG00_07445 [Candidatus Woesearchaeota archaeon]